MIKTWLLLGCLYRPTGTFYTGLATKYTAFTLNLLYPGRPLIFTASDVASDDRQGINECLPAVFHLDIPHLQIWPFPPYCTCGYIMLAL